MNKASKDLQKLLLLCAGVLFAFLILGVGFVLQSKSSTAPVAGEVMPFDPNAEIEKRGKFGSGGSGSGGSFSLPVPVVPQSRINQASWKGRYPESALVEAKELAKPEFASRFILLDICPRSQYKTRHIQGAIWINYSNWNNAFTNGRNLQEWQERIGALGIDVDSSVIVYDGGSGQESARIRSILLYWGVKDVRLLDGGWPAWLFQGAHQESAEPQVTAKRIKLRPNPIAAAENP